MAPQGELLLEKSMFMKRLPLLALRVPKQLCQRVTKILSGYVLNKPRIKHVIADPHDDGLRLVLLSEAVVDPDLKGIPQERLPALRELIHIEVVAHESVLDYSYWSAEEILKEILPPGCEVPSSFETIGHIAHLNLHEELLPYKKTIGEVILDKNQPRIRTVVNKVGTIKNEFRVPEFEILAGKDNFVTSVKQYGATFYLDYRLVYWNSRLEQEHKRLVSQFKRGQVICDMFAGIGPFAIPAALNGCIVYANDLNPASVKYLHLNSEKNKVGNQIFTYNMDAREFMHHITVATENAKIAFSDNSNNLQQVKGSVLNGHAEPRLLDADALGVKTISNECQTVKPKKKVGAHLGDNDGSVKRVSHGREVAKPLGSTPREHFDHVVMNLPASAITFLDVFRGLLSREAWKAAMPYIHCYHFMQSNETTSDVVQKAERIFGSSLSGSSVWIVRDVAPNKVMVCLSFQLPESVAFGDQLESRIFQEPIKRIQTS